MHSPVSYGTLLTRSLPTPATVKAPMAIRSPAFFESFEPRVLLAATPPGVYDFGTVDGKRNVRAIVEDADGTVAVCSLTGRGTAHLSISDTGWDLALENTAGASAVLMKTSG